MSRVVLIAGESHAGCIATAARLHKGPTHYRLAASGRAVSRTGLSVMNRHGVEVANPALEVMLAAAAAGSPSGKITVLSVFGGNYANNLVLASTDATLAFAPGFREGETITVERQRLVPESLARAHLESATRPLEILLGAVLALGYGGLVHLEGPPPIPSADFIRSRIATDRLELLMRRSPQGELLIAPARHRLAFWRIQVEIIRAMCARLGIRYLSPPAEAIDPDGFLREEYWHDAVHANPAYGELVLDMIDRELETA